MKSSKTLTRTLARKDDHLKICSETEVHSLSAAGWSEVRLPHCALPELDIKDVSLETTFLNLKLKIPLMISSMTGGSPKGEEINNVLCDFAATHGLMMGVGSQRVALENRTAALFPLRKRQPKARLLANIGAVQLNYGVSVDDCQWLVDGLQAQALILHANVLQECIQSEGDRNFSGLLKKIGALKKKIQVPLILKETGSGLDVASCLRARDEGVDAFDVAGMGGTHWGFVEGLRNENRRELGEMFRNWGIPSVKALTDLRQALGPEYPLIASGGIKNGLDLAKALYLGADLGAMALPFLHAAQRGVQALNDFLDLQTEALRIALFCTGSHNLRELKTK